MNHRGLDLLLRKERFCCLRILQAYSASETEYSHAITTLPFDHLPGAGVIDNIKFPVNHRILDKYKILPGSKVLRLLPKQIELIGIVCID